ncbi:succinylglutamate desuccinylase/aspartoacylase family protein [Halobacteriaceae archaeon GCM10025711]
MAQTTGEPFRWDVEVPPGEKRHVRFEVSETYLGDAVQIPVTVVNGERDGPTAFVSAAVHGDELNGVKVAQEVAARYDPADLAGTLVVLHVLNVPGYLAQQRYLPIYDQDLNRAFPGRSGSQTADRMAHRIYATFVSRCDFGVDLHTSTRNRTTMYHVRADVTNPDVERLARSFGANLILDGTGDEGSLRKVATDDGIPTITVEMGKAHRFQPTLIEKAVKGVHSALAEYGMVEGAVDWPGWIRVIDAERAEKAWLRADEGGLVEMQWGPYPLVEAGDPICTITDHFKEEAHVVRAPFTGLIVGVLENPVALPGHPLVHMVGVDRETKAEIAAEIDRGEFDDYRLGGSRWLGDGEAME